MFRHDINARRVNIISAIVIIVIYTRLYTDPLRLSYALLCSHTLPLLKHKIYARDKLDYFLNSFGEDNKISRRLRTNLSNRFELQRSLKKHGYRLKYRVSYIFRPDSGTRTA